MKQVLITILAIWLLALPVRAAGPFALTDLPLGAPMVDVRALLDTHGIGAGRAEDRGEGRTAIVHDARPFPHLRERQRLVLESVDGRLARAGAIVETPHFADGAEVRELLLAVLDDLTAALGPPDRTRRRGRIERAGLAEDLHFGRVERFYDWDVDGGTLRLGLPNRLHRPVRVEVAWTAARLPQSGFAAWGFSGIP